MRINGRLRHYLVRITGARDACSSHTDGAARGRMAHCGLRTELKSQPSNRDLGSGRLPAVSVVVIVVA
jgi:hypothetical protein